MGAAGVASGGSHPGPHGALSLTDRCLQDLPESRPPTLHPPPGGPLKTMTKTDPAPMAPPLRGEEEEEEEEDELVPEAPSPTQERRQKPVVHPSAPAPLPKDYGNHPPHPAFGLEPWVAREVGLSSLTVMVG